MVPANRDSRVAMLSLRQKLVLSHLGLVVLAMALAGLYVLHQMEQFYLEQLQTHLIVQAELLAEEAAESLATSDFESLQRTLRTLDQESAMRVRVVDAGGRLVAATETEDLPLLGQPIAALGVAAARAFDEMAARLQGYEAARQELLAIVAHDLHSGTMALGMALEALERGATADPALRAELLRGMTGHTRRLIRLADDLLQTARL